MSKAHSVKNGRKHCSGCGTTKDTGEFGQYWYTTNQGKRSLRYDSRCLKCRKGAQRKRRQDFSVRDRERAYSKLWRSENHALAQKCALAYRMSEHGRKMRAKAQKARDASKKANTDLTESEQERVLSFYQGAKDLEAKLRGCVECDDDMELTIHVDHIIPVSKGGAHHPDNLQLLSARENLSKGAS